MMGKSNLESETTIGMPILESENWEIMVENKADTWNPKLESQN